jgi:hypothetical protein
LKFVIVLLIIITGGYLGLDHLLSTAFPNANAQNTLDDKVMVQSMASFLESNPQIQRSIASNGGARPVAETSGDQIHTDLLNQYFGNSPSDQFFKKIVGQKISDDPENQESRLNQTLEMIDFVRGNPRESLDTLERALSSIPADRENERTVLKTAYIHASIHFIENLTGNDEEKLNYVKRFAQNGNDPEVKELLENHFENLIKGIPSEPANTEENITQDAPSTQDMDQTQQPATE